MFNDNANKLYDTILLYMFIQKTNYVQWSLLSHKCTVVVSSLICMNLIV